MALRNDVIARVCARGFGTKSLARPAARAAYSGTRFEPFTVLRPHEITWLKQLGVWLCGSLLFLNIVLNSIWVLTSRVGLKDLGSFLHSGAAYREHVNPYSYQSWLLPHPISPEALNLNPPISVYLFANLTRLPSGLVGTLFFIGSLFLFALAVWMLLSAYRDKRQLIVILAIASFAGVWQMLWYLQIYAPLILGATAAWLLLRRGDMVLAGIVLGLVAAIKPNFAVVLICLLAARYPRVALPGLATAAAVSAIPLLIDGPTIYRQWLELTLNFHGVTWTSNASLVSIGARLHLPLLGYAMSAVLLLGTLAWQWRLKPELMDCMAVAVMAAVLLGPVSWAGYTLFLLPLLLSRPWNSSMWVVVLLLDAPFAPGQIVAPIGLHFAPLVSGPAVNLLVHGIVGSVYAWAALLLLYRLVQEQRRSKASRSDILATPLLPSEEATAQFRRPLPAFQQEG